MCNPYNLNHTGHIENYKQHIADLQMVALSLSYLILIQFSQLKSRGWMVVCTFRLRSLSCALFTIINHS